MSVTHIWYTDVTNHKETWSYNYETFGYVFRIFKEVMNSNKDIDYRFFELGESLLWFYESN